MDLSTVPSLKHARLPENYVAARDALKACAKRFTPEAYFAATVALKACWETDEAAAWNDPAQALGSYCRMSDDEQLMRLAGRVDKARKQWAELQQSAAI